MKIGVLALQGDFAEHVVMLKCLGVEADFGLMEPLKTFGQRHAIWGTCAGAIFLSRDVSREQPLLGLMDIKVARNAFGRQVDSFEADLDVSELKQVTGTDEAFHAVFIRAPIIESVSGDAKILASLSDGRIVAAQQGHFLATSFHPELTGDSRFHQYFLTLAD